MNALWNLPTLLRLPCIFLLLLSYSLGIGISTAIESLVYLVGKERERKLVHVGLSVVTSLHVTL